MVHLLMLAGEGIHWVQLHLEVQGVHQTLQTCQNQLLDIRPVHDLSATEDHEPHQQVGVLSLAVVVVALTQMLQVEVASPLLATRKLRLLARFHTAHAQCSGFRSHSC
jgi:hypothetical protein